MSWKIWRSNELSPLRIVGIYLAVSWLWFLSSDSFLHMMVGDRDLEATLQTGKSVLFVDVTALLFYFLSVRMVARLDQGIAERKRAEGELRKLTQAQLVQSAKLATLGEMAMAHELNQSLDVIKMAAASWIERIEDGAIDAEFAHGKFARIRAQIARATAIIDHMRIFGRRAEDGHQTRLVFIVGGFVIRAPGITDNTRPQFVKAIQDQTFQLRDGGAGRLRRRHLGRFGLRSGWARRGGRSRRSPGGGIIRRRPGGFLAKGGPQLLAELRGGGMPLGGIFLQGLHHRRFDCFRHLRTQPNLAQRGRLR